MEVPCRLAGYTFVLQADHNVSLRLTLEVPEGKVRLVSDILAKALTPDLARKDSLEELTLDFKTPEDLSTPLR